MAELAETGVVLSTPMSVNFADNAFSADRLFDPLGMGTVVTKIEPERLRTEDFMIAGVTKNQFDQPESKVIRFYDRASGRLIRSIKSGLDGSFYLRAQSANEIIVLALSEGESPLFNDIIHRVIPGFAIEPPVPCDNQYARPLASAANVSFTIEYTPPASHGANAQFKPICEE